MEDRLKIVLQKKAIKNNYKNIDVLPTFNTTDTDNNNSSTVDSIPVATNATSVGVTVEDGVGVGGVDDDVIGANNIEEGFVSKNNKKGKEWGQRITIAFSVAIIMAIILGLVIHKFMNKSARISMMIAIMGFFMFFISLLFGKECGFKTVTFDDFRKPVRIPAALTSLFGAVVYSPYCVLRIIAKMGAVVCGHNECKEYSKEEYKRKVNNDADWITKSACEFFSIPLAYAFTCVLYFASDGPCARPGHLFANDYVPFPIRNIILSFSYIGPLLVYTLYGVYLPKFIRFVGLERISKFVFLFIISWFMVYFFIPMLMDSLVNIFKLKANPMIYIFILLGFVMFIITPDADEIRKWSTYTWKYLVALLLQLILVLVLAPITQLFFSVYVFYYFYSCKVDIGRLNTDLFPDNKLKEIFNVRPQDILGGKVYNFLWVAYLIFFLWKFAELIMGRYNVSKIDGVELRGSLISNMILTVIALIILFALASRGSNQDKLGEVLLSSTEAVMGKQTDNKSKWVSLGLLIFETYQKMKEKNKDQDPSNELKDKNYSKIYERMKEIGTINNNKEHEGKSTDALRGLVDTELNTITTNLGNFMKLFESLLETTKLKSKKDSDILDYLQSSIVEFNSKVKLTQDTENENNGNGYDKLLDLYKEIFPNYGDDEPKKLDRNTILENRYVLQFLKDYTKDNITPITNDEQSPVNPPDSGSANMNATSNAPGNAASTSASTNASANGNNYPNTDRLGGPPGYAETI